MFPISKDIAFEILKYVNIKQLKKVALVSSILNSYCLEHVKTRNTNFERIQIGDGCMTLQVFEDDQLPDMYDFLSKRVFYKVQFFVKHNFSTLMSTNLELKEKIYKNKLPFPLFTCTKIRVGIPTSDDKSCCYECGITPFASELENSHIKSCHKCQDLYCDECDNLVNCLGCKKSICSHCESHCSSCGRGEYCEDCLDDDDLCSECK